MLHRISSIFHPTIVHPMTTISRLAVLALLCTAAVIAGCGGGGGGSSMPPGGGGGGGGGGVGTLGGGKIRYIVIMVQENRSVDNLFNGFPGANTVQSGGTSSGGTVALKPLGLVTTWDLSHIHSAWETEYNSGGMNGFDQEIILPAPSATMPPPDSAYSYVPQKQAQPYWTLAETYTFADDMFATNEGPSFPAHMYLVDGNSATSSSDTFYAMNNPFTPNGTDTGGCDAPTGSLVALINPLTNNQSQSAYPCFDHKTIFDLLDANGATWRYYQDRIGAGLWFTPDAIQHIRYGPDYANVVSPNTTIFSDISKGRLRAVSWVIPTPAESDHAKDTDGSGPSWVASVVNAIGNSKYWDQTAIIIVWDDWGGWYDHVAPPQYNYYELGFRVPLIIVSPYAKLGYVSHVQHEFGSILKFMEEIYGLGSLGETDVRADDLSDCFNFNQSPTPFKTISATHAASYFINLPPDDRSPDDDN
jgi:phospholipase C